MQHRCRLLQEPGWVRVLLPLNTAASLQLQAALVASSRHLLLTQQQASRLCRQQQQQQVWDSALPLRSVLQNPQVAQSLKGLCFQGLGTQRP